VDRASYQNLTIIIPTFNEATNIGVLVKRLLELYPEVGILVVDDASSDGTQQVVSEIAQSHKQVELFERQNVADRGITASVLDALERVTTTYFLVMDGDLQHPPEVVERFIARFNEGAQIVSGARLPYHEDRPLHRTLITWFATVAAKIYLLCRGITIADPMSGFFGGETELVRNTCRQHRKRFEPRGYKVLFDLLRVIDPTVTIDQVFYRFGVRPGGNSKLRAMHVVYYLRSLLR
jgi:dolichol-phosphate mannosyltransferase